MKIGEVWKLNVPKGEFYFSNSGTLLRITRLYRDDEEMQDYVEYDTLEGGSHETTGGGMKREEFLQHYEKTYESR